MIIRSKAPLRLGFAGGGTDVSPFCDSHGGCVLNASIQMHSFCSIEPIERPIVEFYAADREERYVHELAGEIPVDSLLPLHKGVYNRIMRQFNDGRPLYHRLTTYSDAPAGSGLGTSSTMVVAILQAYCEWLKLPLGEYELAQLAFEIERKDLSLRGGKQDQYAAAFGGFNFMEFSEKDVTVVNPLRIKSWIRSELENSLVLFFLGQSRQSDSIIAEQIKNVEQNDSVALNAMLKSKQAAYEMKAALLRGDLTQFSVILGRAWQEKKKMSTVISNSRIEEVYEIAIKSGATAGKVSGAGGGGFMMFMVAPENRMQLKRALAGCGGLVLDVHFSDFGAHAWTVNN